MVVDATVPVLVSLGLLLAAIVAARLVERHLTALVAARLRPRQPLPLDARSLRCPRIVLLDDVDHPVPLPA